jgi:hypothetical protein
MRQKLLVVEVRVEVCEEGLKHTIKRKTKIVLGLWAYQELISL